MLLFGGDNLDNDVGINLMAGYGFTDNFDVEGGVVFYDASPSLEPTRSIGR